MASADDLRIFFALAQTGRVVRAAAQLDVDHTTVSRRIYRLERELGQRLFDRTSEGWTLTHEGELLLVPAEAIEDAMRNWGDLTTGTGGATKAAVRIVCPDAFGTYLVAPALRDLTSDNSMTIELFTTTQNIDGRLRDFDIAVTMERPTSGRVTSWHLSEYRVGIYTSRDYLSGVPREIRALNELRAHTHVGFVDRVMDVAPLQELQHALPKPPEIQCATVALQVQAIAGGAGFGTLPVFVESAEPRLVRILPHEEFRRDYWITVANTTQRLGRIQKVVKLLTKLVDDNRKALQGSSDRPS